MEAKEKLTANFSLDPDCAHDFAYPTAGGFHLYAECEKCSGRQTFDDDDGRGIRYMDGIGWTVSHAEFDVIMGMPKGYPSRREAERELWRIRAQDHRRIVSRNRSAA